MKGIRGPKVIRSISLMSLQQEPRHQQRPGCWLLSAIEKRTLPTCCLSYESIQRNNHACDVQSSELALVQTRDAQLSVEEPHRQTMTVSEGSKRCMYDRKNIMNSELIGSLYSFRSKQLSSRKCYWSQTNTSSTAVRFLVTTKTMGNTTKDNNAEMGMPYLLADIGEGIKEVELIEWFVNVGDTVEQFDKICLVQSDKATVEITSRYDGMISSLNNKVPGDMIQVGEPLLFFEKQQQVQAELHHPAQQESDDQLVKSNASTISNNMNQKSKSPDGITSISPSNGPQKSTFYVNKNEDESNIDQKDLLDNHLHSQQIADVSELHHRSDRKFEASPAVRKLVHEYGITNFISDVSGTGPGGRILKSDVLAYIHDHQLNPVQMIDNCAVQQNSNNSQRLPTIRTNTTDTPPLIQQQPDQVPDDNNRDTIIALKGYNRFMYKTMTDSLRVPQMGFADEIIMNNILQYRADINNNNNNNNNNSISASLANPKIKSVKLSILPFLVKACSLALKHHPIVNSVVYNEEKMELLCKNSHNIGIAVNTARGLVVPVLKNCNQMNIGQIQTEINRLRVAATDMKLTESDLSDATITLSNIGSVGGTYMNPVVVPPTIAIGAFGRLHTVPRFKPTSPLGGWTNNEAIPVSIAQDIYAATIMYVSWSADHRYLDGATLAMFSNSFKQYIENPSSMLVELQ